MTLRFLRELAERALKTFAQTLVALLTAGATTNIVSMPWTAALLIAAGAAVLSVLTSIASAQFGDEATPSLVRPDDE
jgi:hypothetical protein